MCVVYIGCWIKALGSWYRHRRACQNLPPFPRICVRSQRAGKSEKQSDFSRTDTIPNNYQLMFGVNKVLEKIIKGKEMYFPRFELVNKNRSTFTKGKLYLSNLPGLFWTIRRLMGEVTGCSPLVDIIRMFNTELCGRLVHTTETQEIGRWTLAWIQQKHCLTKQWVVLTDCFSDRRMVDSCVL